MNRKRIIVQAVSVVLLLAVIVGCSKAPPPAPPPEPMPVTETEVTPPTEVRAPVEPTPEVDRTPDPWAGDLQEANAKAYADGLLGEVYFDFDQATLKPEARDRLARNARFFNAHREFVVEVEGHCDARGTSEYNISLGERRANATLDYLESLGVSRSRFKPISYGEERPVCRESSEECWGRNRRAYFKLVGRS